MAKGQKDASDVEDLNIPDKIVKKQKGYYIDVKLIKFIKLKAQRLTTEAGGEKVSENDVLTAIINFYRER